jgi:DNA polymerase I-like protein with 3'-5' exonuclease and polymerase domains
MINLITFNSSVPDNLAYFTNIRNLLQVDDISSSAGFYLLEADKRQAEAQTLAWLSSSTELIAAFLAGEDTYKIFAGWIYNCPASEITTKDRRYIGKQGQLACGYGMGAKTFVQQVLNNSNGAIVLTVQKANEILNTLKTKNPNITGYYHEYIQNKISKDATLYTPPPFNRRRIFWGRKNDMKTIQEGYAYPNQSTVVDIVNLGLKRCHRAGIDIRLQGHDSLIAHVHKSELFDTYKFMNEAMTTPVNFYPLYPCAANLELIIPNDFAVGKRWGSMKELKKMTDEEVKAVFDELP